MNTHLEKQVETAYPLLLEKIAVSYTTGQARAVQAINESLVQSYWQAGQHIVQYE